jgi:hypothetical protein
MEPATMIEKPSSGMRSAALWGFAYGCLLCVWAFFAMGAGHGTYLPLAIASSPLLYLGTPLALSGLPILWAAIGATLGRLSGNSRRWPFLAAMSIHYAGIVPLCWRVLGPMDDGPSFRLMLTRVDTVVTLLLGLLIYLAGQGVLWRTYCARSRR